MQKINRMQSAGKRILAAGLTAGLMLGSAVTANAYSYGGDIKESGSTLGIVGSFTNWGNNADADIPMSDKDDDGIWEGTVVIEEVTEDMISELIADGTPTGKSGVQFKLRLNNSWDDSWGEYEPNYGRTYNSQTNFCVDAEVGKPLFIEVKLDTTAIVPEAAEDGCSVDDPDAYLVWPVSYNASSSLFDYEENDDGTITLTGFSSAGLANYYSEKGGTFVFPDEVDGKTVTKIGYPVDAEDAFNENGYLNVKNEIYSKSFNHLYSDAIQLPNTIKEIGDYALWLPFFVNDTLPEGLEKIGDYGIDHVRNTKLVMPSTLKYIGEYAAHESAPKEVVLNEGLEYIGQRAFFHISTEPKEITIPKSVKYIGWDAFGSWAADPDNKMDATQKNTTFNIYGGGYVEQYMKTYVPFHDSRFKAGYNYNIIGQVDPEPSQTESVNGLKVSGAIPEGAEFKAVATTTKWLEDPLFCYEISLNKDGAEVQPDGYITISIPCEYGNGYVVHINEETGEMTNRNSIYVDGYYVFVTDHLSEYGIKFDSEPVKSEVSQSEQSQPDQSQVEQSQVEQSQVEQSQVEQSQVEQSQVEQSKPINPINDAPKTGDSPITAAALLVTTVISGIVVWSIKKRNAAHR